MVLKNILKYLTIFQNSLTSLIHNKNLMKIFFLPNKSSNNDSLFLVYLNVAFFNPRNTCFSFRVPIYINPIYESAMNSNFWII